jgi:type II secretion system protein G
LGTPRWHGETSLRSYLAKGRTSLLDIISVRKRVEMQATLERLRARRDEMGDEGGFTLIELLIVIVILGILAAIVVFAVQNLTGQSAAAGCQSQYKTVETAMEAYKAQVGSYPAADGAGNFFTALTGTAKGLDGNTDGPWLKDLPPAGSVTAAGVVTAYAPSSTTGSQYYLTFDNGTGAVQVGTSTTNGAKANTLTADGNANCASA